MLTKYEIVPENNDMGIGWKAFAFGVSPIAEGRWLKSNAGPGFHIFESEQAARDYISGVSEVGEVRRVWYKRVLSRGYEGAEKALTAEELWIEKQFV